MDLSFSNFFTYLLENKQHAILILQKYFPNNTNLQNELLNIDQTNSKGDIPTIIKFYKENNDLNIIKQYFNKYYNFKKRNIKLNLNNIKNFIEFTEKLDNIDYKLSLKNNPQINNNNDIVSDDADILVNNNQLTIYKGDSQHKCIKYGQGYTFCISRPSGGNMYNSYRLGKSSTFYFIFFKNIPKSNPKHIMVLDKTKNGFEYTFANNNTQETTWENIIKEFPILKQYEKLFVNKELTSKERTTIENIQKFNNNQSLELFKTFDLDDKIQILRSGVSIIDEIFVTLNNNLINEYVSVGPNLTQLQYEYINNNNSLRNYYLKNRELSVPQLLENDSYKFNKLDLNIPLIQEKIEEGNNRAQKIIENYNGGNLNLNNLFLMKLPNITHLKITGNFYCANNNLITLEGSPNSVDDSFYCNDNKLTTLEGAPNSVDGNFNCSYNNLTTLEGAPNNVGASFYCNDNKLTTLEGAPNNVGASFYCNDNKLTTLEGAPNNVGASFYCSNNNLTTLEGGPISVDGDFYCSNNKLTSLEGKPKYIGGRVIK